jgi:hypothetical protein
MLINISQDDGIELQSFTGLGGDHHYSALAKI